MTRLPGLDATFDPPEFPLGHSSTGSRLYCEPCDQWCYASEPCGCCAAEQDDTDV